MAYLTHEEYKEFGYSEIQEEDFEKLIARACDYLDVQTRNFYHLNDLDTDIEFRRTKFKKAVALQAEYMHVTGALTSYDINTPQSWSIGRTSVTEAYSGRSIICDDAIAMLSGTGLLYRGSR